MPRVIVTPDRKLGISGRKLATDQGGGGCCCGESGPCLFPGTGCCFTRNTRCNDDPSQLRILCRCGKRYRLDMVGHIEMTDSTNNNTTPCCNRTLVWDRVFRVQFPGSSPCSGSCLIEDSTTLTETYAIPSGGTCSNKTSSCAATVGQDASIGDGIDNCGVHPFAVWGYLNDWQVAANCPQPFVPNTGELPPFGVCSGSAGGSCGTDCFHTATWQSTWGCGGGTIHYTYQKQHSAVGDFCRFGVLNVTSDFAWTLTTLADCDSPIAPPPVGVLSGTGSLL